MSQVPHDSASLRALVQQLRLERDQEKQRAQELKQHADEQQHRAEQQQRRVEEQIKQTEQLQVELLRVKLELGRYKKWYYGPRADLLQQMLLDFAEELDCKPVPAEDMAAAEPAEELRRVKRRQGRRNLANFENLPGSTQVYELSEAERACPCCGLTRKEIGAEESWQGRVSAGPLRTHPACAQEVCLHQLRDQRRKPQHPSGEKAGDGYRQGPGRSRLAGLYRNQQVL